MVHLMYDFFHSKKEGKIQTGLNCEVDSLSKACLWLAYSNSIRNCRKSEGIPVTYKFIRGREPEWIYTQK